MSEQRITFGIIARTRIPELDRLADTLLTIEGPSNREIIIGVETLGTVTPVSAMDERGVLWLELPPKRGLGYNRNRVLDHATGDIYVGVDDDCVPEPGWLTELLGALDDPTVDAAVGRILIPEAGFVGDSISALGYPAGGSAGYETMFPVHGDGTTENLADGNSAIRRAVLEDFGRFDERMRYGGADTELAYRFRKAGRRIAYVPSAVLVHPARTSVREFVRWFYYRGKAKRQFARLVPIGPFVLRRVGSYGKILRAHLADPKIVLIAPLLLLSVVMQQIGYVAEWLDENPGRVQRSML